MRKINKKLLAQAVRVYEDRQHLGLAKAKTRGEVACSTRKIYRQKGTGGARHGAKSAPIFVGGGVAHGPKGVKRVLKLSKAMIKKALTEAIELKKQDKKMAVVTGLKNVTKTKKAAVLLAKYLKDNRKISLVLEKSNWAVSRACRNLAGVKVLPLESLNAYDVFYGGLILLDAKSAAALGLKVEKQQ